MALDRRIVGDGCDSAPRFTGRVSGLQWSDSRRSERMRRNQKHMLTAAVAALLGVGSATPAVAQQLSQNCIVSVLNRNTPVNPDGSWILPNVPAGFGLVRARANCVNGGITTSGQSDAFTL